MIVLLILLSIVLIVHVLRDKFNKKAICNITLLAGNLFLLCPVQKGMNTYCNANNGQTADSGCGSGSRYGTDQHDGNSVRNQHCGNNPWNIFIVLSDNKQVEYNIHRTDEHSGQHPACRISC